MGHWTISLRAVKEHCEAQVDNLGLKQNACVRSAKVMYNTKELLTSLMQGNASIIEPRYTNTTSFRINLEE